MHVRACIELIDGLTDTVLLLVIRQDSPYPETQAFASPLHCMSVM